MHYLLHSLLHTFFLFFFFFFSLRCGLSFGGGLFSPVDKLYQNASWQTNSATIVLPSGLNTLFVQAFRLDDGTRDHCGGGPIYHQMLNCTYIIPLLHDAGTPAPESNRKTCRFFWARLLLLLIRANPEPRARCGELDRPTYSCLLWEGWILLQNACPGTPFKKIWFRSIGSEFSLSAALTSYQPWMYGVRGA